MQSRYRLHLLFCSFNGEHPDSLRTYLQTVEPVSAPSEEHRLITPGLRSSLALYPSQESCSIPDVLLVEPSGTAPECCLF